MSKWLILDDERTVATTLAALCRAESIDTMSAFSVAEARELIHQHSFAGFLLDYQLPDGTGLEVAQEIRKQNRSVPILFITGYETDELRQIAQPLAVSEIIAKPFDFDQLRQLLRKYRAD